MVPCTRRRVRRGLPGWPPALRHRAAVHAGILDGRTAVTATPVDADTTEKLRQPCCAACKPVPGGEPRQLCVRRVKTVTDRVGSLGDCESHTPPPEPGADRFRAVAPVADDAGRPSPRLAQADAGHPARTQAVVATSASWTDSRCSFRASEGVFQPRVLRGPVVESESNGLEFVDLPSRQVRALGCLCVCQAGWCGGVGSAMAGSGSDLSEEPADGVGPAALDSVAAPSCPPGPVNSARRRSSTTIVRQT